MGQHLVTVEQSRLAPTAAEIALGVVVVVLALVVLCGVLVVRARKRRKR
ncbi:hypothetical protein [Aeromicrobium sp. 50.2.37]|nr:hypothetical protein [Aeromicrobium sp. 50.2.37]MCR4512740.1 hypothetical protein [Aeromicrobium sp. 50.2.37]